MALQTEREKVAHLLRRFGLGASETEVDYYGKNGSKGAIELLLGFESVQEPFTITEAILKDNDGRIIPNPRLAQAAFYGRLVDTVRPLEQKLTLFWHDHFATSAEKVAFGPTMYQHMEVLRKNAAGNFRTLLGEVSKNPGMLFWLDNQENVKGKPNENFAREVRELFTLGVGNYTEKDIQEAARAFTGWAYGIPRGQRVVPVRNQLPRMNASFVFDQQNHDTGTKTVLGKTGTLDGDAVLDHLCSLPRTAQYITEKMWAWFAYPDPEKAVIERLTTKFRQSGLDIKVLVRAIMESPEFYSAKADRTVVKNPVDYVVPTLRALGIGQTVAQALAAPVENGRPRIGVATIAIQSTTNMGMELLFPPDVSGWTSGEGWISTSTMVERIKWASVLFGSGAQVARPNADQGRPGLTRSIFPAFQLLAQNPTPQKSVETLLSVFDANLSKAKVDDLVEEAARVSKGSVTAQNANAVAEAVTKLVFATPEFQFM